MSKVPSKNCHGCWRVPDQSDLGNVGFIFTNADLAKTRDVILAEKVAAPARAGAVAPGDVFVPAGNTGMEPGKTSFFQALGVPTKIARGTIEITTDLKLVEAGSKVGASEATLLNMLNISPFTYGMSIAQVYDDGQTFSPSVLDIKEEQLLAALTSAIATITTISLAANYPTLPSVMHSLVNGYKKALAVAVETDYSWEGIEELKDRIANPDAYAAAAPAAGAPAADDTPAAAAAPADEKSESGSESDEGKFTLRFIKGIHPESLPSSRIWWSFRLKYISKRSKAYVIQRKRLIGTIETTVANAHVLFPIRFLLDSDKQLLWWYHKT